ncbi:MAG: hypothetical protein WB793_09905, partial [Candidatus Dormiibacterota bacterium]
MIPGGEPGPLNDPTALGLAAGVATPSTSVVGVALGGVGAERGAGAEGVAEDARGAAVGRPEAAG